MPLCYRCGAPANDEAEFCPQCGTRLATRNRGLDLLKIFGAVSLALSALVMGAAGACFFLFASYSDSGPINPSNPSGNGQVNPTMLAIGIGLGIIAALFFFGFCKLVRSSPPRPIWLIVLTLAGMVIPALGTISYGINVGMLDRLLIAGPLKAGRGPGLSVIVILAAVVGISVLMIFAANKFFKRK